MAFIKGKQIKDASIDSTKLNGIEVSPDAGKLLLTQASNELAAVSIDGNLSISTFSGSTLTLHVDSVQNSSIHFNALQGGMVINADDGIANYSTSDSTLPTTKAVKEYVDSVNTLPSISGGDGITVSGSTISSDGMVRQTATCPAVTVDGSNAETELIALSSSLHTGLDNLSAYINGIKVDNDLLTFASPTLSLIASVSAASLYDLETSDVLEVHYLQA